MTNKKGETKLTIGGVFVEPRMLKQIYWNIENFYKNLPDLNLYFFCGKGNKEKHIENLKKYKYDKEKLIIYELDVNNLNFETYSDLFKSFYIIDKVKEDYILTIQTDGCICNNSKFNIYDFIKYDYIGGYARERWWWKETEGLHDYNDYQCFNGGFSLRNKKAMIDVINKFKPKKSCIWSEGLSFEHFGEDLYFVCGMLKLNYNVGLDKFAINFCTYTHYNNDTYCAHQYDKWKNRSEKYSKFLEYCPEFKNFINMIKI